MTRRWSQDDDAMLLRFHSAFGAGYVASHDLGRSHSAGVARLKHLTQTGARKAYAEMMLAEIEYRQKAGFAAFDAEQEADHWQHELLACGPK